MRFHTFENLRRAAEDHRDHAATHAALVAEGRRPPSYSDGRIPAAEDAPALPHTPRHAKHGRPLPKLGASRQRILTLPRAPSRGVDAVPLEQRAAAIAVQARWFPAAVAAEAAQQAAHAALCAVRSQYVCIGAETDGTRLFCHVLDVPPAWVAQLSRADYRALRTARHRAQQQPRVPFDPAAFPALVPNGMFAQDARLGGFQPDAPKFERGAWDTAPDPLGDEDLRHCPARSRPQVGRAAMGADPLAFVAGPDRVAPWRKLQPTSASAMPALLGRPARVR